MPKCSYGPVRVDATGTSDTLTFASCCGDPNLRLGSVQSKSASFQPCLDVDETRRETSDSSLSVTSRCADVNLRVIGILVQAESMTVNDEGQLSCVQNVQQRAQYGSLQNPK